MQRQLNRGQFWQQMILGKLDIYTQIIGTWPKSHILYKTLNSVSKWINTFKCKTISILEETRRENLYNIWSGKNVFDMTPKAQSIKKLRFR